MKIIKYKQTWDYHIDYRFTYLSNDDEYIGSVVLQETDSEDLLLHSLYVNEKYRNSLIGSELLKIIINFAKDINCNLILKVHKLNDIAIKLYEKHNFIKYDTENQWLWLKLVINTNKEND